MAATGASLSTIDAKLKFPPNTLRKLLTKGREEEVGPYRDFYIMFRSWAAEARHAAEATMAKKNPEKWMDRNTTSRLLDTEDDEQLAITSNEKESNISGVTPQKLLESLQELADMGISVDEALKHRKVKIDDQPRE